MSDAVKDLIQQAFDQDFNNAGKTFGDIMSVKLSDVLDQEKVRLADQIFNGVEDAEEEDDQLELDLEDETEEEEGVSESDPDAEESVGDGDEEVSDNETDEGDEDSEES